MVKVSLSDVEYRAMCTGVDHALEHSSRGLGEKLDKRTEEVLWKFHDRVCRRVKH